MRKILAAGILAAAAVAVPVATAASASASTLPAAFAPVHITFPGFDSWSQTFTYSGPGPVDYSSVLVATATS